jgi:ankyrin repeat protein
VLFAKNNDLTNQWPLFSIVKNRGSVEDFDAQVRQLVNTDKEGWTRFQQLLNDDLHHQSKKSKVISHFHKGDKNLVDYNENADERKINLINAHGMFGETLLHFCILFENYPLLVHIAKKYPHLINAPKLHPFYLGETPLHMLAAKGRFTETQFLIRHHVQIEVKCVGGYYHAQKGKMNHGETPLTFATCVENLEHAKKVLKLLIDSGSDLLVEDRRGYNILHILAFNNNVEIYRFMHENWKEKCAILEKTVSKSGKLYFWKRKKKSKSKFFFFHRNDPIAI